MINIKEYRANYIRFEVLFRIIAPILFLVNFILGITNLIIFFKCLLQ
mgnify:CR=1 FL=1